MKTILAAYLMFCIKDFLFLLSVSEMQGLDSRGHESRGWEKSVSREQFLPQHVQQCGFVRQQHTSTSNMDTYPYRAYLENLISYGSDVEDNQPESSGTKTNLRNLTTSDTKTSQHVPHLWPRVNSWELQGRLHLNLVLQEKYLPNGVDLRFRLNRASPLLASCQRCRSCLRLTQPYFRFATSIVASHSQRS